MINSDYNFNGSISRAVLENYLGHAKTMVGLLQGNGHFEDNLRMLANTGARFAGRTMLFWGAEGRFVNSLAKAQQYAQHIHRVIPEMILQAGIFEIVTRQVATVPVPDWVYIEFGLPVEKRAFRYEDMIFLDGTYANHWSEGASVPDITRLETQLWIFFMAAAYINAGIEAIHFGQIMLIGRHDPELTHWWDLLEQIPPVG